MANTPDNSNLMLLEEESTDPKTWQQVLADREKFKDASPEEIARLGLESINIYLDEKSSPQAKLIARIYMTAIVPYLDKFTGQSSTL